MKTLLAILFASAMIASPAFACSYGKTASVDKPEQVASLIVKTEKATSTYMPSKTPIFEEKVEAEATDKKLDKRAD